MSLSVLIFHLSHVQRQNTEFVMRLLCFFFALKPIIYNYILFLVFFFCCCVFVVFSSSASTSFFFFFCFYVFSFFSAACCRRMHIVPDNDVHIWSLCWTKLLCCARQRCSHLELVLDNAAVPVSVVIARLRTLVQ